MDLGKAIKSIRKQKGLKQYQLAKLCDITQAYLSRIENNKIPKLSMLKEISKQLEIPLPIIFFLSLDIDDVEPEKSNGLKIVEPMIKSLMSKFLSIQ